MKSFVIVDDHPRFRKLARLILERAGYTVLGEAADAASGISTARELTPDVVLLDVNLPDGSGFDVADHLCEDDPSPAIVMTSTYGSSDYESLARSSGARGFVPKDELSGAAISRVLAA